MRNGAIASRRPSALSRKLQSAGTRLVVWVPARCTFHTLYQELVALVASFVAHNGLVLNRRPRTEWAVGWASGTNGVDDVRLCPTRGIYAAGVRKLPPPFLSSFVTDDSACLAGGRREYSGFSRCQGFTLWCVRWVFCSRHSPVLHCRAFPRPGRLHLVDGGGILEVRQKDDNVVGQVGELLHSKLIQRPSDGALVVETPDGCQLVSPKSVEISALYLQVKVGATRTKLKAYRLQWCNPQYWWEARYLGKAWGLDVKRFTANMMRNHWRRWEDAVSPFLPLARALHRRADPRGHDRHYMRCLPESTLSTHAVLLLTLWRGTAARGDSTREGATAFLQDFIAQFFMEEDVELELTLDFDVQVQMGCVHSGASTVVPIDRGVVYLSYFTQALDETLQDKFVVGLGMLDIQVDPDTGTMRFADFLLSVYHLGIGTIIAQVVGQTASFIEVLAGEKGMTPNAMQVEEDEPSLPKHARHDRRLVDQLAMGQGLALDEKQHWQQGAFVRTFHAVTQAGKRMRVIPPKQLNESIMLRQLQTSCAVLMEARHINVAIDGTRLGRKDVNFLAVGGVVPAGGFRISWAPIQAPHGVPGGRAMGGNAQKAGLGPLSPAPELRLTFFSGTRLNPDALGKRFLADRDSDFDAEANFS